MPPSHPLIFPFDPLLESENYSNVIRWAYRRFKNQ